MSEIRYAVFSNGENIYKNGQTYKQKRNAQKKVMELNKLSYLTNTRIDIEIREVEVETTEDKVEMLEQENQKLKELVKEAIADLERHKKALDHCKGYLFMLMSDEEQARARKEIEAILNKKSHE